MAQFNIIPANGALLIPHGGVVTSAVRYDGKVKLSVRIPGFRSYGLAEGARVAAEINTRVQFGQDVRRLGVVADYADDFAAEIDLDDPGTATLRVRVTVTEAPRADGRDSHRYVATTGDCIHVKIQQGKLDDEKTRNDSFIRWRLATAQETRGMPFLPVFACDMPTVLYTDENELRNGPNPVAWLPLVVTHLVRDAIEHDGAVDSAEWNALKAYVVDTLGLGDWSEIFDDHEGDKMAALFKKLAAVASAIPANKQAA
jgi:hypothetical protein